MTKARDIASAAPAPSTVSATELGYLDGVTSAIQTQLDAKTAKSTLTTTGDIYYASAANTPARLEIGTTGQILSVAGGVPSWANVSSVEPFLIPETAGHYVRRSQSSTSGTFNPTEDRTYYVPIYLPTASFDRISVSTSGNFGNTATVRLGLYNASATTGKPTTLVFDAGTVAASVSSTTYEITISQSITNNFYYMAFNMQAFTGDGNSFAGVGNTLPQLPFLSVSTGFSNVVTDQITHFYESSITGAFTTAGTLVAGTGNTFPIIGMRIA